MWVQLEVFEWARGIPRGVASLRRFSGNDTKSNRLRLCRRCRIGGNLGATTAILTHWQVFFKRRNLLLITLGNTIVTHTTAYKSCRIRVPVNAEGDRIAKFEIFSYFFLSAVVSWIWTHKGGNIGAHLLWFLTIWLQFLKWRMIGHGIFVQILEPPVKACNSCCFRRIIFPVGKISSYFLKRCLLNRE